MSRALMEAAQRRYAPRGLYILWRGVASPTAAERFVEAVASRWERLAFEMEKHLEARRPDLSWSSRSPVSRGRSGRGSQARRRSSARAPSARQVATESVDRPASSIDQPDFSPAGPATRTGSARVGGLDPGTPMKRGRRPRRREAAAVSRDRARDVTPAVSGRRIRHHDSEESAPEAHAREDVPIAESTERDHPPAATGAAGTPYSGTSRRRDPGAPWAFRGSLAGDRLAGRAWREKNTEEPGDLDPPPAGSRDPSSGLDPAADADEQVRRRFDSWYAERCWRDAALREWKSLEF